MQGQAGDRERRECETGEPQVAIPVSSIAGRRREMCTRDKARERVERHFHRLRRRGTVHGVPLGLASGDLCVRPHVPPGRDASHRRRPHCGRRRVARHRPLHRRSRVHDRQRALGHGPLRRRRRLIRIRRRCVGRRRRRRAAAGALSADAGDTTDNATAATAMMARPAPRPVLRATVTMGPPRGPRAVAAVTIFSPGSHAIGPPSQLWTATSLDGIAHRCEFQCRFLRSALDQLRNARQVGLHGDPVRTHEPLQSQPVELVAL